VGSAGIETRAVFAPVHRQAIFAGPPASTLPVAERLAATGLSLPSGAMLSEWQIDRVCAALMQAITDTESD
jgi:perosamine synthetase